MTRLAKKDMEAMDSNLYRFDQELIALTGRSLLETAAYAMGKGLPLAPVKAAVIPITTGLGVIDGFSEKVRDILKYLGAAAFTTAKTDLAGMQEAFDKDVDVVVMADDQTFSAFHLKKKRYSDNSIATGRGFAAALDLAADLNEKKEVLVLGGGPVGQAAIEFLLEKNIPVVLGECDQDKARICQEKYPEIRIDGGWSTGVYKYIIEATPAVNLVKPENITSDTIISAPGVPLGVTAEAGTKAEKLIHNLLELGVATMLCEIS